MMSWVKCSLLLSLAFTANASIGSNDVVFHLFTRANPTISQPLLSNAASIMTSSFSLNKKTIVTIHNHGESVSGNANAFLVPASLSVDDVNVLAVDWSLGSTMYTLGLSNAPEAGRLIAVFINILIQSFGYNPNLIHIVGVGLGGHIAGIASRQVLGTVNRITAPELRLPYWNPGDGGGALTVIPPNCSKPETNIKITVDPSLHGWTHNTNILKSDDASEVEVVHTTSGRDGYDLPLGTIDFYPNGGSAQNGCASLVSCSHMMGYIFLAESFEAEINSGSKFIGRSCDSFEDAQNGRCTGPDTAVFGGTESKAGQTGIFFFTTNPGQPFAQG